MSDHTPIISKLDIIMGEVSELKQRVRDQGAQFEDMRAIQIENCGRDGRNGKLLAVRTAVDDIQKTLQVNQQAIEKLMHEQKGLSTKVALYASLGAGALATVVPQLLRLIGG